MTKNNNLHRVHCILAGTWHIPVKTATNMKTFFKKLCRELRVCIYHLQLLFSEVRRDLVIVSRTNSYTPRAADKNGLTLSCNDTAHPHWKKKDTFRSYGK